MELLEIIDSLLYQTNQENATFLEHFINKYQTFKVKCSPEDNKETLTRLQQRLQAVPAVKAMLQPTKGPDGSQGPTYLQRLTMLIPKNNLNLEVKTL